VAWHEALEDARDRDEAAIIVNAFAERGIDIVGVPAEHGGIAYMYARDRILARQQHLGGVEGVRGFQRVEDAHRQRGVLDVLREQEVGDVEIRHVARGIVAVNLSPDRPQRDERDAHYLLGRIEDEFGAGLATLDHVVTTAQGHPTGCPATEPQEVYNPQPYPPVCPGNAGHGVRIYVADTGIVRDTVASCPWLDGVTGDDDPSVAANGTILPYGGHGTFVAGVIRCMAPGAEIVVRSVFDIAGSALESDFVPKLYEGFAYGAEIFHVTVSSPTRFNVPLMAFETWLEDLRRYKGVACVVPAGNSESPLPHWPAAFPGSDLGRGARVRLAQPCVLQRLRRLGRRVRARPEPGQRVRHRYVQMPRRPLHGGEAEVHGHGAVERDVLLHADRDRAHRGPDDPARRERRGGGRRPAGPGAGRGDPRRRAGPAPRLRRRRAMRLLRR
jgi:hypothetical protein